MIPVRTSIHTVSKAFRAYIPHVRHLFVPHLIPASINYSKQLFLKDIISGTTVALVLIPNVLAYALLTGLPPVMGLYAALPAVLIATLWGSSRFVITAPVGVVSLLAASSLTAYAAPHTPQFITLAITLAILTGIIQLLLGFLKMGVLTRLISHATLVGFTNAAALVIALAQLPAVLGITIESGLNPFGALWSIISHAQHIHPATALIGVATIAVVLYAKRIHPSFPTSLVIVCTGLFLSALGVLPHIGIATIGAVPAGLPQFSLDAFSPAAFATLLQQACLIALVGFIETYSIAQSLAKKSGEKIDANKELVGQGGANLFSGLFGGFPVSGSFSSSALHAQTGSVTRVSGVVIAIIIFITLLLFAPLLSHIPQAILSGVVIAAVLQLVRVREFLHIFSISKSDGIIALITAFSALIFKPDEALVIGIIITLAHFILRSMNLKINEVVLHKTHNSLWTRESTDSIEVDRFPQTLLLRLDSSLLFSNAELLEPEVWSLIRKHQQECHSTVASVVINCSGLNVIDLSGIEAIQSLKQSLTNAHITLAVMVVKDSVLPQLTAAHFFNSVRYINGTDELRAFCEQQ